MSRLVRSSAFVSLAGLFGSVLGMVAQLAIARTFGSGLVTDAYFAAMSWPLLVGGLVTAGISYHVVPAIFHSGSTQEMRTAYGNALLKLGSFSAVLFAALGVIVSETAVKFMPDWNSYMRFGLNEIAMFAWGAAACSIVGALLAALSQARQCFLVPAVVTYFPPAATIIACTLLGARGGNTVAVAAGVALAQFGSAAVLFQNLRSREAVATSPIIPVSRVARELTCLPWIIASMAVFSCFGVVDAIMAAPLAPGSVSILAYAQRIVIAVGGIAINGAGVVLLPKFSDLAARGEHDRLGATLRIAAGAVAAIVTPVAVLLAALARPAISLLFVGGKFDGADCQRLAGVVTIMALGLIPMAVCTILFRGLYALREYYSSAAIGIFGVTLYVAQVFLYRREFNSILGFPVAYTMAWLIVMVTCAIRLRAKIALRVADAVVVKYLVGVGAAGVCSWWVAKVASGALGQLMALSAVGEASSLAAISICAILVYVVIIVVVDVPGARFNGHRIYKSLSRLKPTFY